MARRRAQVWCCCCPIVALGLLTAAFGCAAATFAWRAHAAR